MRPQPGKFYPRFDAVVLLSAPADVILRRVATRLTNDYGKSEAQRDLIVQDLACSAVNRRQMVSQSYFRTQIDVQSMPNTCSVYAVVHISDSK